MRFAIKQTLFLLFMVFLFAVPETGSAVELKDVNIFIGTGGIGYGVGSDVPGPSLPFGMARPGPDTALLGTHPSFHHCGGYHYGDNQIRGFSNFRLSGVGIADYGNVLVMPTLNMSGNYQKERSYRERFSHKDESAGPGYYAVTLRPSGIRAELTATRHCGVHRYSFPETPGRIIIDAAHTILPKHVCEANISYDSDLGMYKGRVLNCGGFTARNGGVEIFFAVRVEGEAKDRGKFGEGGAWVEVSGDQPVTVFVGISFISVEQAVEHVREEALGRSFDEIWASAEKEWQEALSVIEVEGGSREQRRIFATALYHSMIMPTDITETGGSYRGLDEKVHNAEGRRYYSDFSLWDTFRTLHPLLVLIEPERTADMMQSLVVMSEQGGYLPKWPTSYRYTNCMIGASADNAIADAFVKGIRDFDYEKAYAAMKKLAFEKTPEGHDFDGRVGVEEYMALGYVPSDMYRSSTSRTIEFSYNDWCIAQMAKEMGNEDDYQHFMERSENWRNLYDERTGFIRAKKSDGSWKGPFLEWSWTSYYTEGNARQWLWAPLHDVDGLVRVIGGRDRFVKRLDSFFRKATMRPNTLLWDNYYWHGNEPDIHASYLFNAVERPDLTQKWTRWAMEAKYMDAPNGLDGNDDAGTLSAWYVFSALGFYPLAGSDVYFVGSPVFDRAVIHLDKGDMVLEAGPDPAKNIYVEKVTVNGRELDGPFFKHHEIAEGGKLVFTMSSSPSGFSSYD